MTRNDAMKLLQEIGLQFIPEEKEVRPDRRESLKLFRRAVGTLSGNEEMTRKPCPGCGTAERWAARRSDKVCRECAAKISGYDALVKKRERTGDKEYALPERADRWPYFHFKGRIREDFSSPDPLNDVLRGWLWKAACLMGRAAPDGRHYDLPRIPGRAWADGSSSMLARRFTDDEVAAIEGLDAAIRKVVQLAFAAGVRDGTDLLGSMADGSITADEFNKKSLRLQEER